MHMQKSGGSTCHKALACMHKLRATCYLQSQCLNLTIWAHPNTMMHSRSIEVLSADELIVANFACCLMTYPQRSRH